MEPMKKGHHRLEVMSHYYGKRIQQDMSNFVKWILLALLIGGVVGGASSLFAGCLGWVTQFRTDQPVVVLLLPFGGLLIVFLYQKIGKEDRGTTQVLSTIRSQDEVPLRSAPLIFIATALTHLLVVLRAGKVRRSSWAEVSAISWDGGSIWMRKTAM